VKRQHPPSKAPPQATQQKPTPVATRSEWSGPLPQPAILEEFGHQVRDGAERIFHQFEAEARHRREMEIREISERVRERKTSQILAGAFFMIALGIALYALHVGAFVAASIIGGATIASIAAAFLLKHRG
jgi:uncharacterized membrane protein